MSVRTSEGHNLVGQSHIRLRSVSTPYPSGSAWRGASLKTESHGMRRKVETNAVCIASRDWASILSQTQSKAMALWSLLSNWEDEIKQVKSHIYRITHSNVLYERKEWENNRSKILRVTPRYWHWSLKNLIEVLMIPTTAVVLQYENISN